MGPAICSAVLGLLGVLAPLGKQYLELALLTWPGSLWAEQDSPLWLPSLSPEVGLCQAHMQHTAVASL